MIVSLKMCLPGDFWGEDNANDLPEQFTIVFQIDRVAVDCEIAWRRGSELGINHQTNRLWSTAAPMKPLNSGWGSKGRDLSSG